MLKFRQVAAAAWPQGDAKPLAVLPLEPSELSGVSFERDQDGLGDLLIAVIKDADGLEFGLLRYMDSAQSGTGVYVVVPESALGDALSRIERLFEVSRDRFLWVSPLCDGDRRTSEPK